jgi:hypothetical protein
MKLRLVTSGALTLGALTFGAGPALADGSSTSSAKADTTYTAWFNVNQTGISQGVTGHSSVAAHGWNGGDWNSDDSGWRGNDGDCDGGSTSSAQADTTYTAWLKVTQTGISQGVTGHSSTNRQQWNAGGWNSGNSGWHGNDGDCGDGHHRDDNGDHGFLG